MHLVTCVMQSPFALPLRTALRAAKGLRGKLREASPYFANANAGTLRYAQGDKRSTFCSIFHV
jgi:hypothetical protein